MFGILGNHDDDHDMPAALAKNGVQVLKDARTRLRIKGETVDLIGIRFWTKRQIEIADLVRDSAPMTILLAHDPRRLTEAAALGVPLVLSGHTHGGQVVLPLVGAIAAQKFPIVAGQGHRGRTTMFVSRGVGTVYVPVRLNCPPEVAVLTLRFGLGYRTSTYEAPSLNRPAAVEHQLNRFGINPMLFEQDARRQRIDRVVGEHRDRGLNDDRPAVQFRRHQVDRRARDAHAMRERLSLRIESRERREQRRVDIQDPIGKRGRAAACRQDA